MKYEKYEKWSSNSHSSNHRTENESLYSNHLRRIICLAHQNHKLRNGKYMQLQSKELKELKFLLMDGGILKPGG